jgi:hypothetical protein
MIDEKELVKTIENFAARIRHLETLPHGTILPISIDIPVALGDPYTIKWVSGVNNRVLIGAHESAMVVSYETLVYPVALKDSSISFDVSAPTTYQASIALNAFSGVSSSQWAMIADSNAVNYIYQTDDLRIGGGLYVGGVGTDPDDNDIWLDGDIRAYGGITVGANIDPTPGRVRSEYLETLTGNVTNAYAAAHITKPSYTGAFTVDRHNYIYYYNPTVAGGAAVTDACVMRFDAAPGAHLAVDSGTTHPHPQTTDAWIKVNINDTIYFLPAYTHKT